MVDVHGIFHLLYLGHRKGWDIMEKTANIGKRISEYRQNKNMSQEEMANRVGVTPQAVSKWERGQSLPDVALLADICFVLGESAEISLTYIMKKLSELICSNYAFILSPDLVKKLVDNLQSEYPAAIQGVVPEKISYGLLTEVLKKLLAKRNIMPYLLLIIEYMENILREQPEIKSDKLVEAVLEIVEES